MQEEETLVATDAEEPTRNLYPVDAQEFIASVDVGRGRILKHIFARGEMADYIERERLMIRETEQLPRNRERPHFDDKTANAVFHNKLCTGGRLCATSGGTIEEMTRERMNGLTDEQKSAGVNRLLESKASVRTAEDDFAFMFESEGEIAVDLLLGDAEFPAYTITFVLRRPERTRRAAFLDQFTRIETLRTGDLPRRAIKTDLRAGTKFIAEHFKTVEGVQVNGEAYREAHRAEFLRLFNPVFQGEVAAAVVSFFEPNQ